MTLVCGEMIIWEMFPGLNHIYICFVARTMCPFKDFSKSNREQFGPDSITWQYHIKHLSIINIDLIGKLYPNMTPSHYLNSWWLMGLWYPEGQFSVKFHLKFKYFHTIKRVWKCCFSLFRLPTDWCVYLLSSCIYVCIISCGYIAELPHKTVYPPLAKWICSKCT